jgi:PAS domain S-box-containing protein
MAERAFVVQRGGGSERFEGTLVRGDGEVISAIIAGSAILDPQGRFTGVLSMLTDITERKAIETRYRLLTEATPQIIWTADARGKATFINEQWTALTGRSREAALGYGWSEAVHADDLPKMLEGWRLARAGGGDFEAECRLRCADGERYRWHLIRALARRDERGVLTDWLGSMTDIDTTRRLSRVRDVVARAGDVLNRSLDLETLLERFAALLVEDVADEATIRLAGGRTIVSRRIELPADAPVLRAVLVQRDTQLGSVVLRKRCAFEDDERAMLYELTARAGAAIDNTLLYEREHRVAVTLQRALLPAVLPRVDGVDFDAVYYPGATDAEIGGDWYDAIALPGGRVVVSIGDVTGRGLTAAVIMGRMRQAIETLATYESDPTRLLDAADAVLRRTTPDAIVTALVGVIDPSTRTLVYATAGHPTPFVREVDGRVRRLPGRGLPLGLRDGRQPPPTTLVLPPWALALFYTDGLIESTRDIEEGERRVIAALRDTAISDGTSPASALVARVIDGPVRDDVAVMAVRIGDAPNEARPWTLRWRFEARDARRTYDVREAFVEALGLFGTNIDIAAAQLVFGELIGNAVRYTPGVVDIELDWLDTSTPVLHVIDHGPGFTIPGCLPKQDVERGRGLYLVSQLTREFEVWKENERGAHARAVLLAHA